MSSASKSQIHPVKLSKHKESNFYLHRSPTLSDALLKTGKRGIAIDKDCLWASMPKYLKNQLVNRWDFQILTFKITFNI